MWNWDHMSGYANGWGWGGMLFGGLIMVLFWALVIAGVVWLVRTLAGAGPGGRPNDALATLKERYARGEIDRETYQRMRKEIER